MCGITGFLYSSSLPNNASAILGEMTSSLNHRGPDDSGIWSDSNTGIGLGHVRLSILDVSPAGHQPMVSSCGRFVIAFNGEIYNHLELRTRVEANFNSYVWRGHSDTETLLACISAWGVVNTLSELVGMFSFSLWDKSSMTLTLARDRMGEKPLYWGRFNDVLIWGSELKALKKHPLFTAEIDQNALASFLRHNYIPAPSSIYKSVHKLEASSYVQFNARKNSQNHAIQKYWSFLDLARSGRNTKNNLSDEIAISRLEHQLTQSIGSQMLADVPIGAFLSGGIDSSIVVALMQKQTSRPVETFAIGFNEPGYNEAHYAKEVSSYLGTKHTELYVDALDALAVVPRLPQIFCEPFADSSQIPTYLLCQLAKKQVTVALSGDGGDELFGGYNPYKLSPKLWNIIKLLPLQLRLLIINLLKDFSSTDNLEKILRVLPSKDRESFYIALISHWQNPDSVVIGSSESKSYAAESITALKEDSFEHWMMAFDMVQYMPDDILVKVDRAAMANSLETRVPLLDHRLVEFAWQLPLHQKIRNGTSKWILREVLYRNVPRHLIDRPKKGFAVPIAQWLRGPLRDWAESLISSERLKNDGYFHVLPVRNLWQDHLLGKRNHALRLWSILMFQAWLDCQ